MDLPPPKSHFAVAGGLGRFDLSCCAWMVAAAVMASRTALPNRTAFRMVKPSPNRNSNKWTHRKHKGKRTRTGRLWCGNLVLQTGTGAEWAGFGLDWAGLSCRGGA